MALGEYLNISHRAGDTTIGTWINGSTINCSWIVFDNGQGTDCSGVPGNGSVNISGGVFTGTDDYYIYNDSGDITLNETRLNITINALAVLGSGNTTEQMIAAVNNTALNLTTSFGYLWSNIVDPFITAVDNIWIYMVGTTATFNETKLNQTISGFNSSWNYTIDTDTWNTTEQMQTAVNSTNTFYNIQINWSNILNRFITAVDNIYFYMSGTTATFNETKLNETIDARFASISYNATNIETIDGTYDSGNLTSIEVAEDGLTYNVTEGVGADPLTVVINFTNVVDFNQLIIRLHYIGGLGHEIKIGLWHFGDSSYEEEYGEITDMEDYAFSKIDVLDSSNHIQTGNVSLRFRHVQNGNAQHSLSIDFVNLVDGFSTITTNEHDGLTGRDDPDNHPWALPRDGSKNMSGDFNVGGNNITNADIITANNLSGNINAINITSGNLAVERMPQSGSWVITGAMDFSGDTMSYITTVEFEEYIRHAADADTNIRYRDDRISLVPGAWSAIDMQEGTTDNITFGSTMFMDDTLTRVGINTVTPRAELDVDGTLFVEGDFILGGIIASMNATNINVNESLNPTVNNTQSLGNFTHLWEEVHIGSGDSTFDGNVEIDANLNITDVVYIGVGCIYRNATHLVSEGTCTV